ncbi:MAG: NAD(P)/FAD-dependent oxidoreductase [bacterium]
MKKYDVIIIGAGAAGLMCAIEAGKRGRTVLLIEHTEKVGKKILISGGGRCNFTNLEIAPKNYLSANPHFCKSALARYTQKDFIGLVEKHNIPYHEKTLGQLFCNGSSREIVEMLVKECEVVGVEISLNVTVTEVKKENVFFLTTSIGEFESDSLVIASGGLSIPKMGSTDFGYLIAKQFGLGVIKPYPALVPLTWKDEDRNIFSELSGISLAVRVSCKGIIFKESMLFTHKGLSGPAILQISSYWKPGDVIEIDLFDIIDIHAVLLKYRSENLELGKLLSRYLPRNFVVKWCEIFFPSKPLNQISDKNLRQISELLHHWKVIPRGTEGYEKAEVTAGGIDTKNISSKTMEANDVKGLFFTGEVLDVTGWLGGYNFQWAWSSGWAAGQAV